MVRAALLALLLAGCPSPNTYTAPRTIPAGTFTLLAAAEGWGVAGGGEGFGILPSTPTLGVRAGLTDRIDVGARLPNLLSAALDAKINLLRGQLDLSINPGVQWYEWTSEDEDTLLGSGTVVYLQAPVLLGYNASPDLTLMGSLGPAFSFAGASSNDSSSSSGATFGQLGFGAEVRVSQSLSLVPQFTFIGTPFSDGDGALFSAGLGFNFGAQASYADLAGAPAGD